MRSISLSHPFPHSLTDPQTDFLTSATLSMFTGVLYLGAVVLLYKSWFKRKIFNSVEPYVTPLLLIL